MQFQNLLNQEENRAVSPVIGVILMVAITVILAAVIGTFVLGLGDQVQQTAPNANFAFDFEQDETNGNTLDVTHNGGDGVDANNLYLTGDVSMYSAGTGDGGTEADGDQSWANANAGISAGDPVRAGDSATIFGDANDNSPSGAEENDLYFGFAGDEDGMAETVRVVWRGEGDRSSTLRTWNGPNA